jgi:hypothetical protein
VIFAVLISYSVTALRSGWLSLANHHWHGCTGARVAWHALQLFIQRSIVRGVIVLLSILPEAKGRHHLIGGTSLKCLSLSAHGFRCTHSNQAFVPYWTGQEDLVFHLCCQCLEVRACISCFALMIIPVCSRWELASAHHACPALDKALKHNIYYDICVAKRLFFPRSLDPLSIRPVIVEDAIDSIMPHGQDLLFCGRLGVGHQQPIGFIRNHYSIIRLCRHQLSCRLCMEGDL